MYFYNNLSFLTYLTITLNVYLSEIINQTITNSDHNAFAFRGNTIQKNATTH